MKQDKFWGTVIETEAEFKQILRCILKHYDPYGMFEDISFDNRQAVYNWLKKDFESLEKEVCKY